MYRQIRLIIKLVRYADSTPDQRCPVPVNIVLDEMNNIGVIPDFSRRLSTIRSRALQVVMCCQNLPQIQNRYPNNLWAELIGNADTQLMLGCTDDVTAEYCSARSGDMTVIRIRSPLFQWKEGAFKFNSAARCCQFQIGIRADIVFHPYLGTPRGQYSGPLPWVAAMSGTDHPL